MTQIFKKIILIYSIFFLVSCQKNEARFKIIQFDQKKIESNHVIYGDDNRVELKDVTDAELQEIARSTVALISKDHMVFDSVFDHYNFENPETSLNFCPSEKFRSQPQWAFCSGALIASDLIVTAGHCFRSLKDCSTTQIVFDYAITENKSPLNSIPAENVFHCAEILYSSEQKNAADFAIIRLDRPVEGRKILSFANEDVAENDQLMMIGHPNGLPTKLTMNGKVRSLQNENFFVASIDSYTGNSGSAVFNQKTKEIVGVLARGENDYELKNSCYVSKVCAEDLCRGEDVTRARVIKKYIP